MAKILLGVSGGIAAYKALELARLATLAGHGVRVVMTEAAAKFVGPASFEGITGAPVLTSEFDHDPMGGAFPGEPRPDHDPIGHLELAARCEAFAVAPASANTVAKLAHGFADSMLTTSFLACEAPRLVAPAMNDRMLADAATQDNLDRLRERGVVVVDPEEGELASRGERGAGRLPAPDRLLAAIESLAGGEGAWAGLRVLVTAGGTREPIDAVRYIGNRSSGRMGLALARAAARRGAEVTLIAANVGLPAPAGVRRVDVETVDELTAATRAEAPTADVVLMAAAPADFRPPRVDAGKMARNGDGLELRLEATEDILASLAAARGAGQTLVGFAAEHGEGGAERAREKLARKGADLIVLNDVSDPTIGFESGENAVTLIGHEDAERVPRAAKEEIAESILDRVDRLRDGATPGSS